jgi:hypothetical protein
MIVVKVELWPRGDKTKKRMLGKVFITNIGGDVDLGTYKVEAAHAGIYYGRKGFFKTGKVIGFPRRLSPYRLLCRALKAIGEI